MSLEVKIKKKVKGFELDVDFQVDQDTFGILGASGCGKSMTLKCIAGIMTPDSGFIKLNDKVLYDSKNKINLKPQERNVGYLFQNYALFPNMTVLENIGVGYKGDKEEKDQKVKEMMEMFHLEELKSKYPKQLSGGQQQRAALARMLIYEPDIMLLDEPFSALDMYLKEELQLQLSDLLRKVDKETIIVTHDRDEVYKLCNRLMVIDHGKVLACEDTKEMFHDPSILQVARLTGCKNLVDIQWIDDDTIEVAKWGVRLKVQEDKERKATHIGIRAHDFIPYQEKPEDIENIIPCSIAEVSEGPFEWNILFKTSASEEQIYWKMMKSGMSNRQMDFGIKYLSIDPKHIMLLTKK
ncbi:MAG TPA: ATP-binding cassette domain-containing protein [Candidatus Merdenecus merdavium]|nr:ATP-binding cassette domain-containing protein [Candidatus Merdenecus merdavium]